MKSAKKLFTIFCTVFYLAMLATVVGAAGPSGVSTQVQQLVDLPKINSFTSDHAIVVTGDSITFRWNVAPGPGSSPIASIKLSVDGNNISNSIQTISSITLPFHQLGERTFILTVRNNAGLSSTRSVTVRGISLAEVMSKISIANLEANPQRFFPGQQIDFNISIHSNTGGVVIQPVNIFVTQGPRVVANLTNISLHPGFNPRILQDSGFTATGGNYTVDLEFKGQHKMKIFTVKPVTMFTIDPLQ